MENDGILELYADFLICNNKQASATNLSHMVDGKVSHDSVTRMLSGNEFKSIDLWHKAKSIIREVCPITDNYKLDIRKPGGSKQDAIDIHKRFVNSPKGKEFKGKVRIATKDGLIDF